ncbi:tetratricopeptide repeat protein [Vagococcus carniphilus]|uniref:Tetratricopeptide repeat protein n=1 Tax=Vagococcus carniphilus TaxID=218144 RepID=A0AAW8U4K9_9ENTE|nr:tetratricopeptide repeat protein [Vagococcus carniphilus]MDT2814958.1 tetratricopeptide repeat protein [Vagococcus carniphilus]MDT2831699.1 tetratricopeptide repeat protein [Vagococcus carniphilus]MDT2833242.1 tetratricopeptide repeat protein [Vagococcus carniphilus]MDT2840552.1 tetratricopeptide repeat protein [Vagococcus carniphilus]MDT2855210.1 tetratricopeptide repeat protein [Vagococcus carniphilus]
MFNFMKKKKNKESIVESKLTEEEIAELDMKLEKLITEVKEISDDNNETKAEMYEQIGLIQSEVDRIDDAILSLEKSLDYKLSIGDGYKKLMSLYNAKRAMAAKEGNDAGIDFYMDKMDEMRQIAKKVTLSR